MQGSGRALRVRHSARNLTDGGGLVLVRALFDSSGWRAAATAGRRVRGASSGRA